MGFGCLSERGLLGFLWDSWDLVLVVGGIELGETIMPRTSPCPHPGPLPLLMGVLGDRGRTMIAMMWNDLNDGL